MYGVIADWKTYVLDVSKYMCLDDIKIKLYELTTCRHETIGHDCVICFKNGSRKISTWNIYWNNRQQRALHGVTNYLYYIDGVLLRYLYKEIDKIIFFDSVHRHPSFKDDWEKGLFSLNADFGEKCDEIYRQVMEANI